MTDFTVLAVRYCTDVPAMAAFLETVGLTRRISTVDDGFVVLVAGGGLLMLHSAATSETGVPPGQAELALQVTDLDATQATLIDLDLDPVRWDESYGQHLGIRDPRGEGIWINEVQRDLYGYEGHHPQPNDFNLLAIRYSDDFVADVRFYEGLGFRVRAGASPHFTALDATRGATIGLHPPDGRLLVGPHANDNPVSPPVLVDVALETHEDLRGVADRLRDLDARYVDGPAPLVRVIDPEGIEVQIHAAP